MSLERDSRSAGERAGDVAVVGAGPAGLAATSALAGEGLEVVSISPTRPPQLPNTYGIWSDELRDVGLGDCAGRSWSDVRVWGGAGASHRLGREYVLVDNDRLRSRLSASAEEGDVARVEGAVRGLEELEEGVRLELRGGDTVEVRLAVDATGHRPALVERAGDDAPGFQTAYGVTVEARGVPFDRQTMVLMDFRTGAEGAAGGPATFLYAMPLEGGRWFFEETVLVARPAVGFDLLERSLERRLDRMGITVERVHETERVRIPMGLGLPSPTDRVLPFGGAASMVHPASGYMLGNVLQGAGPMARAVAGGLQGGGRPQRAVQRGWESVWPRSRQRAREMYLFGMETLLAMEPEETRRFFDAFFSLPLSEWSSFLAGRGPASAVASTMWRLFAGVDMGLKGRLAGSVLSAGGSHLLRGLVR